MQQQQYRAPAWLSILSAVTGAFIVIISGILLIVGAVDLRQVGVEEPVIGGILLLFGALFITSSRRPGTLTVDDAGLRLRTLFRTRAIPWSRVRSFEARSAGRAGYAVWMKLSTGKKIPLPGTPGKHERAEQIAAALSAALSEHLAATK